MKANIVRTVLCAALLAGPAAPARAQTQKSCPDHTGIGTWGYIETGTLILPTGAAPFAVSGKYTQDADGNLSGVQITSAGGAVTQNTIKGLATLNSDCTVTVKVDIYDNSGNALRTAVLTGVFVNDGTEILGIVTSLVMHPTGANVPAVVTINAKKVFPGAQQ